MARRASQGPLIIQNENLDVYNKKTGFDGNGKSSKLTGKKSSGVALGNRKALNDITNKKPIHRVESSLKNKNVAKVEEFNEAEEMFLHDHKKCIEEQQRAFDAFSLDLVLPGHGSKPIGDYPDAKQAKTDASSPCCYPEPEELSMSEFSDWLECSARWVSPPSSPMSWDSTSLSPFGWEFEEVEYVLKQEADLECNI